MSLQTEVMKGIAELDLTGFAATEDEGIRRNAAGVEPQGPPSRRSRGN
jgi:hypothetical protein